MLRRLAIGTALWWLGFCGSLSALGLGEIEVRSQLNQPFSAALPLSSLTAEEAQSLQVRLASPREFERAGIERSDYLSTLQFEIEGSRVRISSPQPAREPFLTLLIEARSAGARVLREYTVLLDPPNLAQPAAPASMQPPPTVAAAVPGTPAAPPSEFYQTAEEASRVSAGSAATAPTSPAAAVEPGPTTAPPAPALAGGGTYGPVRPQETFWSIAKRLRPNVTMEQMLVAMYRANPQAFVGGIDGLQAGATLRVPPIEEITAIDADEARREVARLRGQRVSAAGRSARPRPGTPAPPAQAEAPSLSPAASAPVSSAAATVAPAAAAPAAPAAVDAPTGVAPAPQPDQAAAPAETPSAPGEGASPAPLASDAIAPSGTPSETPSETPAGTASAEPAAAPASDVAAPAADSPRTVSFGEEEEDPIRSLLLPVGAALLLLLAGVFGLRSWKRRREAASAEEPVRPLQAAPAVAAAAAAASARTPIPAAEKRQDPPAREQEALQATQRIGAGQFGAGAVATAATVAPPKVEAAALPEEAPAPKPAAPVDFDVTAQFAADTLQIDLDANDPIAEADFHLAYGLYDEAALLLKQATEKAPQRTELRIKLAETYFAAGKPAEFQQIAEALRPQVSASQWQKLAILGRQLSPDSALFKDVQADELGSVDISFDDPPEAPLPGPAAEVPPEVQAVRKDENVLDFSFEELELPSAPPAQSQAQSAASEAAPPPKDDAMLEFDLSDFDLSEAAAPPGEARNTVSPNVAAELDTQHFDLSEEFAASPSGGPGSQITPHLPEVQIRLDEFELGEAESDPAMASDDEAGTKLDLARAYVDMGDTDMARSLLAEVCEQGNPAQQAEAQELLARLPA